jgi:uncharacterized membrane protein
MILDFIVFGVLIALIFVLGIVSAGIGFIPGFMIFYIIAIAIGILNLMIRVYLGYKAYKGETYKLPVIGDWAGQA